jgi:hypothetical protein
LRYCAERRVSALNNDDTVNPRRKKALNRGGDGRFGPPPAALVLVLVVYDSSTRASPDGHRRGEQLRVVDVIQRCTQVSGASSKPRRTNQPGGKPASGQVVQRHIRTPARVARSTVVVNCHPMDVVSGADERAKFAAVDALVVPTVYA